MKNQIISQRLAENISMKKLKLEIEKKYVYDFQITRK